MKLSVVIPVYNEVNTIREILSSVLEIGSGIGNMTRYLLDREFVLATEV
jgi:16S rRNA A1518/A1519 N6-dimethyltransferase RsmA/KsgA/DIM1 with predicted DNA glycosylase/AP lyase activity